MGSTTDLKIMKEATLALKEFSINYEIKVVSAHRTPEKMVEFAKKAIKKYHLIIAGAGGAAHLPGMVASLTTLPVIGVPILIGSLKGLDALLSILQMPQSVPVATVGVNNAYNAGLLAVRLLGMSDPKIAKQLEKYRLQQIQRVNKMNKQMND